MSNLDSASPTSRTSPSASIAGDRADAGKTAMAVHGEDLRDRLCQHAEVIVDLRAAF